MQELGLKNKYRLILALVLAVLLTPSGYASEGAGNSEENPDCESQVLPRLGIHIWRYYGQKDFSSVLQMTTEGHPAVGFQLTSSGFSNYHGRFYPSGSLTWQRWIEDWTFRMTSTARLEIEAARETAGGTHLERNLDFPLHVMQSTNYIDAGIAQAQVDLSLRLHPDNVTFFEITTEASERDLRRPDGSLPPFIREEVHARAWRMRREAYDESLVPDGSRRRSRRQREPQEEYEAPPRTYLVKTGSAWLVSGQSRGNQNAIPLEDARLLKPIDRTEFPHIYEFGRAAQTTPHAFENVIPAALFQALTDALVTGADLNRTYIFAHSLGRAHTLLYRSRFGMSPYSGYRDAPNETALVAPVLEILRRYPISRYSPRVRAIREASRYLLSEIDSLRVLVAARRLRSTALEDEAGNRFFVRDFSALARIRLERFLFLLGLDRHAQHDVLNEALEYTPEESRDHLAQQAYLQAQPNFTHVHGIYIGSGPGADERGLLRLPHFLAEHRAIEIFVPDRENPPSRELLERALARYIRNAVRSEGLPVELLESISLSIAVTGEHIRFSTQDRVNPDPRYWYVYRPRAYTQMNFGLGRHMVPLHEQVFLGSYARPFREILGEGIDQENEINLVHGVAAQDRFLMHPDALAP